MPVHPQPQGCSTVAARGPPGVLNLWLLNRAEFIFPMLPSNWHLPCKRSDSGNTWSAANFGKRKKSVALVDQRKLQATNSDQHLPKQRSHNVITGDGALTYRERNRRIGNVMKNIAPLHKIKQRSKVSGVLHTPQFTVHVHSWTKNLNIG
ncbi:uncharacterized protein LOC144113858 [Amblyomma americanum]